jgi:hypothetical protein
MFTVVFYEGSRIISVKRFRPVDGELPVKAVRMISKCAREHLYRVEVTFERVAHASATVEYHEQANHV